MKADLRCHPTNNRAATHCNSLPFDDRQLASTMLECSLLCWLSCCLVRSPVHTWPCTALGVNEVGVGLAHVEELCGLDGCALVQHKPRLAAHFIATTTAATIIPVGVCSNEARSACNRCLCKRSYSHGLLLLAGGGRWLSVVASKMQAASSRFPHKSAWVH